MFLIACERDISTEKGFRKAEAGPKGDFLFWVIDYQKQMNEEGYFYQKYFNLAHENSAVKLYVATSQNLPKEQLLSLTKEFKDKIYPKITGMYGLPTDVNKDGKISVLLFDILDVSREQSGLIRGYFLNADLYKQTSFLENNAWVRSNEAEIVYLDCLQSDIQITLAHEFQHLVGFSVRHIKKGKSKRLDTWLSEALAMEAMYDIYGQRGIDDQFKLLQSTHYDSDNSLIKWNKNTPFSNYALSATFINFVGNKVMSKDTFLRKINEDVSGNHLSVGKGLNSVYGENGGEINFDYAFYDYAVKGLYLVEPSSFPSVSKGDGVALGSFRGLPESNSNRYEHYGYTPVLLHYPIGESIRSKNASIVDINKGFSKSFYVNTVSRFKNKNYGVVFLTAYNGDNYKPTIEVDKMPIRTIQRKDKGFIINRKKLLDGAFYPKSDEKTQ